MTEEELKQKAKDWCKSKNLTPSNVGYFTADYCEQSYIAGATETTKELEKENAELKGEADSVLDNWCRGNDPCPHLKKRDEQLTKAKELLKEFVHHYKDKTIYIENMQDLLEQVERFIKDSEVEK